MLVNRWRTKGWFLSILLSGEGSWEKSFFFLFFFSQQLTMLQSPTLSYECDQSQSPSHILVCPSLRSRFSGLLTWLTLWGRLQPTIQTVFTSFWFIGVPKYWLLPFFQLLISHELQCSVWYAKKTWNVALVK